MTSPSDGDQIEWLWCPQCFYSAPAHVFAEYLDSEKFGEDCDALIAADGDPDAFTPTSTDEAADLRASGVRSIVRCWPDARLDAWRRLLDEEREFRSITRLGFGTDPP